VTRVFGSYAGKATDQILPPGLPGYEDFDAYPLDKPDFAKAKRLAGNQSRQAVMYTSTSTTGTLSAQVVQANLKQIGIDVQIKQFPRGVQIVKLGTKGEPFDLDIEGWGADYADPFDFINVLLDGNSIHANNNNNFAYFNDPGFNRKMEAAARLSGDARYGAYAKLDQEITTQAAPWASFRVGTQRDFFSAKMGCQMWQPIYQMDLGQLCVRASK
jgi:peptide/nickel transport system substrate-binding protein